MARIVLQVIPADDATRGLSARQLLEGERWKDWPVFLNSLEAVWPGVPAVAEVDAQDPEVKWEDIALTLAVKELTPVDKLLFHYSSWKSLQRAVVHSKLLTQRQGELLLERATAGKPTFAYTGVDCFSPFQVSCMRRTVKRFGCVFTCFNTRAVHIEALQSLDADAFLNALMHFISQRGTPEKLFSDRGTNFQRADKDICAALHAWNTKAKTDVTLTRKGITWEFLPPAASHMGEPQALTPNHILQVDVGNGLPLGDLSLNNSYRRRWTHAQALADCFWKRWRMEYMLTLRARQRQIKSTRNLRPGDIVLVVELLLPWNQWRLARVTHTLPGSDELVRKARIRTGTGTLTRHIVKLCLLEAWSSEAPEAFIMDSCWAAVSSSSSSSSSLSTSISNSLTRRLFSENRRATFREPETASVVSGPPSSRLKPLTSTHAPASQSVRPASASERTPYKASGLSSSSENSITAQNPQHLGRSHEMTLPHLQTMLVVTAYHSPAFQHFESMASREEPQENISPTKDHAGVRQQSDMLLFKGSQHITPLPVSTVKTTASWGGASRGHFPSYRHC
ncbi:hypothetical protein O3P69_008372 [Scylla paramamosain]|uniref:DUF5641 domain-containing protein n=1 Tax=Scylla paramamosain TaxID=85552 RepID=A0AAW0SKS2_SCYPA